VHQRQERGLAAAVLAGDARLLAAEQTEGGVGEQHPRAAAHRDIGKIQHGTLCVLPRSRYNSDSIGSSEKIRTTIRCQSVAPGSRV